MIEFDVFVHQSPDCAIINMTQCHIRSREAKERRFQYNLKWQINAYFGSVIFPFIDKSWAGASGASPTALTRHCHRERVAEDVFLSDNSSLSNQSDQRTGLMIYNQQRGGVIFYNFRQICSVSCAPSIVVRGHHQRRTRYQDILSKFVSESHKCGQHGALRKFTVNEQMLWRYIESF